MKTGYGKTRKKWIVGLVISLFLSAGYWVLAVVIPKTSGKTLLTQSQIVGFTGVFESMEEEEDAYLISLRDTPFKVSLRKDAVADAEGLTSLSGGESVRYALLKAVAENADLASMDRVVGVTFSVGGENVMTLESYNDATLRTMRTASALGMAAGSIFLGVAVLCAVKTALSGKREKGQRQNEKKENDE